jgi:penicillin-binding protein 1C
MDGVSGVSGAGPLLHRVMLATAARHAPGVLPTAEASGATPVSICRLSGLRPTARCPKATEWFAPGTVPTAECDWHRMEGTVLPLAFAEWAQQTGVAAEVSGRAPSPTTRLPADPGDGFRILSPQEGDVYRMPAGVDPRYATVALRAAGAATGRPVRWFVDGRLHRGGRWVLERGRHRIRALDGSGAAAEIGVAVE